MAMESAGSGVPDLTAPTAPTPAGGFGQGRLLGRAVPCLTAEVQLEHHCGYQPRERDRLDMAALAEAFGLTLPSPY